MIFVSVLLHPCIVLLQDSASLLLRSESLTMKMVGAWVRRTCGLRWDRNKRVWFGCFSGSATDYQTTAKRAERSDVTHVTHPAFSPPLPLPQAPLHFHHSHYHHHHHHVFIIIIFLSCSFICSIIIRTCKHTLSEKPFSCCGAVLSFFFEFWTVQDQLGGNWMNVTACLGVELIDCFSV